MNNIGNYIIPIGNIDIAFQNFQKKDCIVLLVANSTFIFHQHIFLKRRYI